MNLGEKKKEIINLLADPSNTAISQSKLSQILGIKQSSVSQHINELEDKGLIEVDKSRNSNDIKELTRSGYQAREKAVGINQPISENEALDISLHNFVVKFKLQGPQDLEWVERALAEYRTRYDPTNSSYLIYTDKYHYRITSRHIFVMLEDFQGSNPNHLKNRALLQAFEARDFIENKIPVGIGSRPSDLEIWINRQHLSIIQDPFAEIVDQYSDLELSDVKIYDSNGKERLWLDSSNGPELEAGNAPGENRAFAEEDIDFIKKEYAWKIQNKEKAEKLRNIEAYEKRLEGLENELNELKASESPTISDELSISSKWRDRWGNVMGYSEDLNAPVKIYDSSDL